MQALAHVVFTRFNLATPGRESGLRNAPGWLEGRFDLFERYCLPTMAAQTTRDFAWLILFDEHTPDWARERVARAQAVCPFTALYIGLFDGSGWGRMAREAIGEPQPGRLFITSNLDNDDGLAANYLERVQACARATWRGETFAVNAPWGLVLANRRVYLHHHPKAAFTNMVEADAPVLQTTKAYRHMDLPRYLPVVQLDNAPGWLQVIHETNVSNKVRGYVIDKPCETAFPASVFADVENPAWHEKLIDNRIKAPARLLRDQAFALARRIKPADPQSLKRTKA